MRNVTLVLMRNSKNLAKVEKHKGEGHRGRLRERFLQGGLEAFLDYEIVELLLTLGTPRKDCKDMAKIAIEKYNGLHGVLDATLDELQTIKGIGPSNAFGIKLFQAISERYAKEKIPQKVSLSSPKKVADYLRESIGREKKEHFVVLSFDTRNNILGIDTISIGILNANLVHPRETFETAIHHHAASIIIAHNHPSGNPNPSDEDIKITVKLFEAGKLLDIHVLDHIIIGRNTFYSFKEKQLLSI